MLDIFKICWACPASLAYFMQSVFDALKRINELNWLALHVWCASYTAVRIMIVAWQLCGAEARGSVGGCRSNTTFSFPTPRCPGLLQPWWTASVLKCLQEELSSKEEKTALSCIFCDVNKYIELNWIELVNTFPDWSYFSESWHTGSLQKSHANAACSQSYYNGSNHEIKVAAC